MANSSRLNKNRGDQMFIPMNIDGGVYEPGFFNSFRIGMFIVTLVASIVLLIVTWDSFMTVLGKILCTLLILYIAQLIIRYIVLEEKYYYKMYKKMKEIEVTTPSVFWNIISIKETDEGAVLCYGDGKVGTIIRVDRDTIIGKNEEFIEMHYDAISDFYKELNNKGLSFVQANIMEHAGKDPRIKTLDDLVKKPDNKNMSKIIEAQVSFIKKITRATLFETEYFLIYVNGIKHGETIISDAIECIYKLLGGAYVSYSVLDTSEIVSLVKDEYGVKYFDMAEASNKIYKNMGANMGKTFELTGVRYTDGEVEEITKEGTNRLLNLTSYVKSGNLNYGEWSVKEALRGNIRKNKNENDEDEEVEIDIDLDSSLIGEPEIEQDKEFIVFKKASDILDDIMYGEEKKEIFDLEDFDNIEVKSKNLEKK